MSKHPPPKPKNEAATTSLKDKLKGVKPATPTPTTKPATKPARAGVLRQDERAAPKKSDEELFAEAVAGVNQAALAQKFDQTPSKVSAPKKSAADKKADDEALFESFVGTVKR
ncbi:MAG TPA: hypothetical protein VGO62_03200 [Myxococcota bacterium]|jgi:hypothetical protein